MVVGGLLGLISPLGPIPLVIGVFLLVLGTVVAAPDAGRAGSIVGPWWTIIAVASLVALIGAGFEVVFPDSGRLLVVPASLVAVVTAGLTLPVPVRDRPADSD